MPAFLLCVEALLDEGRRARGRSVAWYSAWAAAAGAAVSWLHPWQGETLLAIVGGIVLWTRAWRRVPALIGPAAATAAPIAYYLLLSHYDAAWHLAAQTNRLPHFPLWILLVAFAPLGIAAAAGATDRPADVQERILRLWPLACLVVYFVTPSVPAHALEGVSLPLAVLAVRGWTRLRAPALVGALAVAVLVIPGAAVQMRDLRREVMRGDLPFALRAGEDDALGYVASRRAPSGGVLAPLFLAQTIPERTGHAVWVGHPTWSPDFGRRNAAVEALFAGRLGPDPARQLVRVSGARLLVADCRHRADLQPILGPLVAGVRRFGCATVYEVRPVAR
jgi:hypothetical protein